MTEALQIQDLLAAGDYAQALRELESAQAEDPGDLELWQLRMTALSGVGQFELARSAAMTILAAEPTHSVAAATAQHLNNVLLKPGHGSDQPLMRSWKSGIPQSVLEQLQHGLHQQRYRGQQIVKSPFDMAVYREFIWDTRPATIVEIGSKAGGSALFLADLLRNFEIDGRIISLDVVPVTAVNDPLVDFRYGDGRRLAGSLPIDEIDGLPRPLFVIEDADHVATTTRAVLEYFDPVLLPGEWIVVEDTNLGSVYPDLYPSGLGGAAEGLSCFLAENAARYRIGAEYCDFFGYNWTTACNGFLQRLE